MSKITERALAAALKRLMEKKPLSKITVTDLAKECGINRHTFYYHFKDLYDLVDWIYIDEIEQAAEKDSEAQGWKERLRNFFTYALENKSFIMGVCETMQKEQILRMIFRYHTRVAEMALREECPDICLMPERREFVVNFYSGALRSIIMRWLDEGMKTDPEELIALIAAVFHEDGRNVLLRVADVN